MRLTQPFHHLPVTFDHKQLLAEVEALGEDAWWVHPNRTAGNSFIPLITVGGGINDDFAISGQMEETDYLKRCPYLRQVLAHFSVPLSRTRLMRIAGPGTVPLHIDYGCHWFKRVRVHIPVLTQPEVRFSCDDQKVHMAAGEAWILDNSRPHGVENPTPSPRIHLVFDTKANASFWEMLHAAPHFVAFAPDKIVALAIESYCYEVFSPEELEALINETLVLWPDCPSHVSAALAHFLVEWRASFEHYGRDRTGEMAYSKAIHRLSKAYKSVRSMEANAAVAYNMRALLSMLQVSNRTVPLHKALHVPSPKANEPTLRAMLTSSYQAKVEMEPLEKSILPKSYKMILRAFAKTRVAEHVWNEVGAGLGTDPSGFLTSMDKLLQLGFVEEVLEPPAFERPVFILAAPRSGSSLLFECLTTASSFWALKGEAHGLLEQIEGIHPASSGWHSNRLTAEQATTARARAVREQFCAHLLNRQRQRLASISKQARPQRLRMLEKTPKSSLRLPFLNAIFPDALFILLFRDPWENISSIMEGWRSGRFITYPELPNWESMPWSFTLPPGWQKLQNASLAEIAAHQWCALHEVLLSDLNALEDTRWTSVSYHELLAEPEKQLQRLLSFAQMPFERMPNLENYSAHTYSAPKPDKWRKNQAAIQAIWPQIEPMAMRIQALQKRRESAR